MREEITLLIERYQDNLFAAAFSICKNAADANDIIQETFLQYYTIDKQFETEQHIKAWLIRVAINKAKNINHSFWKQKSVSMEDYINTLTFETAEDNTLFEVVMHLPEKYRIVIHLFYYEDYSIREIADILKIREENVKVRLNRGRKLLKKTLKEDWVDDDQ